MGRAGRSGSVVRKSVILLETGSIRFAGSVGLLTLFFLQRGIPSWKALTLAAAESVSAVHGLQRAESNIFFRHQFRRLTYTRKTEPTVNLLRKSTPLPRSEQLLLPPHSMQPRWL